MFEEIQGVKQVVSGYAGGTLPYPCYEQVCGQQQVVAETIAKVNASQQYNADIVTQVLPLQQFWPAEAYHQGYYRLPPDQPYSTAGLAHKVVRVRKLFSLDLKLDLLTLPE